MEKITAKTPWKDYMGEVPMHLDYFEGTMFEAVEKIAQKYPDSVAFDFMGKSTTYRRMVQKIEDCAKALKAMGICEGDKITIAMPNCPQAVFMFYAVNLVGGIANMIHPLSAEKEIEFYLNESESVAAITLDQFYQKFANIRNNTKIKNLIIARIKDELPALIKVGYALTEGRKITQIPADAPVLMWQDFLKSGRNISDYKVFHKGSDPAVILYSGGTTGTTKGIVLTNKNFNAPNPAPNIRLSHPKEMASMARVRMVANRANNKGTPIHIKTKARIWAMVAESVTLLKYCSATME